jgi:hypothetical protein
MRSPDRAVKHEREDHHTHVEPPTYAEAGRPGPQAAAPQMPQMAERTEETERDLKSRHRQDGSSHGERRDAAPRERDETRHPVGSA